MKLEVKFLYFLIKDKLLKLFNDIIKVEKYYESPLYCFFKLCTNCNKIFFDQTTLELKNFHDLINQSHFNCNIETKIEIDDMYNFFK